MAYILCVLFRQANKGEDYHFQEGEESEEGWGK